MSRVGAAVTGRAAEPSSPRGDYHPPPSHPIHGCPSTLSRLVAWAVDLVVVMDGALTLALPPARPVWVALLRPFLRVPGTWYLATMWYQLEPLLDATRLALLIPAVVGGAGLGAARRAREESFVPPAA